MLEQYPFATVQGDMSVTLLGCPRHCCHAPARCHLTRSFKSEHYM